MYDKYLLTGATGYLGGAVLKRLLKNGAKVRALVMPGDRLVKNIPDAVETVYGAVDDAASLTPFFDGAGADTCVIHCAGIVSVASKPSERLWRVNVDGTRNITALCAERGVAKLVYVSSVHALPEKPRGQKINETSASAKAPVGEKGDKPLQGDINLRGDLSLRGEYAKTKAAATEYVLAAAREGLNASVVHPSGIIGPDDEAVGSITGMMLSYLAGKLPVAVRGGYDFVDVRDVADGILACCERGRAGERYILSNRFITIRELLETVRGLTNGRRVLLYLPLKIARLFAPLCEKLSLRRKKPLYFTPYSIDVLGTNADFSHDKATRELGYHPRGFAQTAADTVRWLTEKKLKKPEKKRPRRIYGWKKSALSR